MNHIDSFFSKLKGAFASQSNKKRVIADACYKIVGITLTDADIEINNRFVRVSVNSSAKSAMFMKKAAVLEEINKGVKPAILDIR